MRVAPGVILREWGRIGCIGFGGPPTHVALLRELVVERRGWMDAREFEDANAACGLLPGPASTQLAIYCARRVGGARGAVIGAAGFILPGLVLVIVLAAVALGESPPRWILGLGAGAGAAVVVVVARAALGLGRAALAGRHGGSLARATAYLAAGALATVPAGAGVVLVLLGCGLLEVVWRGRPGVAAQAWPALLEAGSRSRPRGWPAVLAAASALPPLAWTAFKVGALSYGGGFVIIPLMESDAVGAHAWMTHREFTDAVAFGQLTPGPVVQTVAVVGYAAAGMAGALLAAAVAFAPSLLVVVLGGGRFAALRANATARAFLDGAGPAAVGAIAGALVPLVGGLEEGWQAGLLALSAAWLIARPGRPAVALLGAGAAGVAIALAGGPLPGG